MSLLVSRDMELAAINAYRIAAGMVPLPSNETLNEALKAHGVTHCFEIPYPWMRPTS